MGFASYQEDIDERRDTTLEDSSRFHRHFGLSATVESQNEELKPKITDLKKSYEQRIKRLRQTIDELKQENGDLKKRLKICAIKSARGR